MNKEKFDKKLTEVQKHMLTGISYMIPVIVASGTILGIASLAGQAFGFNPGDLELLETSSSEFVSYGLVKQDCWWKLYEFNVSDFSCICCFFNWRQTSTSTRFTWWYVSS